MQQRTSDFKHLPIALLFMRVQPQVPTRAHKTDFQKRWAFLRQRELQVLHTGSS